MTDRGRHLIPFSRLISIDTDGRTSRMLGQRSSFYDARLRQFDGAILDWLRRRRRRGADGARLCSRGGADRHPHGPPRRRPRRRPDRRAHAARRPQVEPPNARAGRLYQRRARQCPDHGDAERARQRPARSARRTDYFYRTAGSRDWRAFGSYDIASRRGHVSRSRSMPTLNAAYVLQEAQRPLRALPGQARRLAGDRAGLRQRAGRRRRRRPRRAAARA